MTINYSLTSTTFNPDTNATTYTWTYVINGNPEAFEGVEADLQKYLSETYGE